MLDASVTLAWFYDDERDAATDAVLARLGTERAVAPGIWPLEVANALLVGERRGRCSAAEVARFLTRLESLPIEVDAHTSLHASRGVLALARAHGLTSYDAAYLELAARRTSAIATRDAPLRTAAKALGVPLLI
ncbi:MAG: type II toxin-antitoxin system VapC family toxin [Myxococcota bacterium]